MTFRNRGIRTTNVERWSLCPFLILFLTLAIPDPTRGQTVLATVPVGAARSVAVNPVTDKIYVANCSGAFFGRPGHGSVTVIDGKTNTTTTITATCPVALAVNPVTNKIYVADYSSILVIDGATNSTTTVAGSPRSVAVAVNSATNEIYLANASGNPSASVTVLDGPTNSITTIADPNTSGLHAVAIAANPATNRIYVANSNVSGSGTNPGNITVIDGATNATTTVTDPNAISPQSVAVNSVTNKIYVANGGDYPGLNHGNITVIDGATNSIITLTDPNALDPLAVAVNQTTNKIYVTNANDAALTGKGGVSVIDGATNMISFVSDPNGYRPRTGAVDPGTNTIYVTNEGCYPSDGCINPGFVTLINGATNSVMTLINPNAFHPNALAVNAKTSETYVAGSGNVMAIDDGTTATSHILLVELVGNGSGTVTSSPAGINCVLGPTTPPPCTASFPAGTAVSLTALPASWSTFSGWTTNCTGAGACNLTMTSDDFLVATFTAIPGRPDFSLQPASANLTTQRGAQVTDVITIAPLNGTPFATDIHLSCAVAFNPPVTAMPTCAISPSSLTPGANSVTSTLTITVPSQSAELVPPGDTCLAGPLYAASLPIPLGLIGFGLASGKSKHQRRPLWLVCGLLIAFVALQAGCGGGSSNPPPPPPLLNFTVTVTATSGAIQHTTQVTVTVP